MVKLVKLMMFTGLFFLIGCSKKSYKIDKVNVPETISREEWRKEPLQLKNSSALKNPGKIYRYGNYLYVNEINEGIHVYDNTTPSSPIEIGFIELFLNTELAIYNDVMFANSYSDLILLDVSNPSSIKELNRLKNVFDVNFSSISSGYNYNYSRESIDLSSVVVTGWKVEEVRREIDSDNNLLINESQFWGGTSVGGPVMSSNSVAVNNSPVNSGSGVGGSMAKFTIAGNKLFMLEGGFIRSYDISTPTDPKFIESLNTTREAQTLFPRGDQLFVGTTSGMLIYGISNSGNLSLISSFEHFTSCDPVVVEGDRAYVTLSSGCLNISNQLDVIDISDLNKPTLIKSYEFTHPLGLGVDQNTLFLCDDGDGLKVFDVTDPLKIDENQLSHFSDMNAFDVIPYQDLLILVGEDGFAQYDYSNIQNIVQLSSILIQK